MWVKTLYGGALLGAVAFALAGCSSQPLGPSADEGRREARLVTEADEELAPVVLSNNRFTWSAYQAGIALGQNLFFSPLSLSMALGMTSAGARGTTAEELWSALASGDADQYHVGLGALGRDLAGEHAGRGYQLYLASALFGDSSVAWNPLYRALLERNYGAPLTELSFRDDPEHARATVNAWVGEQTRQQLPALVREGDFDSLTRFALVSACYFEARWADAFDARHSYEGAFQLEGGGSTPVTFMTRKAKHRLSEQATFTLAELDYADRELSLLVLLPHDPNGLPGFEASLSVEQVEQALAGAADVESVLELPRFELRSDLPLADVLLALGVREAFDPSLANFSYMLAADAPQVPLFLTRARHQAFVQVDEQGTRAAAATAVVGGTRSTPTTFRADRPFVFLIRDKLTGAYLFAGRLMNPNQ